MTGKKEAKTVKEKSKQTRKKKLNTKVQQTTFN